MYNDIFEYIRSLFKCPDDFLPLHEPRFWGNEISYVTDAIDSTYVSSVGDYVNKFEETLATYTNARMAIAICNGTSALHLGLRLVGVERDTEVLMQPLSFIATANAASYLGAVPHFIDVDIDSMGLSPIALKKQLEAVAVLKKGICFNSITGRRITACVPMHTFGFASRIKEICQICEKYHIPVVEDAAESLGTTVNSKHTGTFGDIGIFSFNGNKTITSGGGGAIVTNNLEIGILAKHLSTTAKEPHAWEYSHDLVGYNYRLPNLNAALLCAQMEQLDSFIAKKRITATLYQAFFKNRGNPKFKTAPSYCKSNHWLNAIEFKNLGERDNFLQTSNENGIMTRPIWKLLNNLSMYKKSPSGI